MKTSPHFCVYTLRDPRDNSIFYVGKGTQKRMYEHNEKATNRFLRERIQEIKDAGLKIKYSKLLEHADDDLCYDLEKVFIKALGLENLCNIHPGGRGVPSGDRHPSKDPKVRAKMSEARRKAGVSAASLEGLRKGRDTMKKMGHSSWLVGRVNHFKGKKRPGLGIKISAIHKSNGTFVKERNPFFGKHHSEEARQKNKLAHIGKRMGDQNGNSKLEEFQVVEMHRLYKEGWKQASIARHFKVCRDTVGKILHGELWRHVFLNK